MSAIVVTALWILASSLGQELSQVPDVADWQTYRNPSYGYEIRYPDGFEVWPTGSPGQRDGRSIRVGRSEYAAPVPVLDVYLEPELPCEEYSLSLDGPDVDMTAADVAINGVRARQVTYLWKSNSEIAFVNLCIRDTLFQFQAPPGLQDFHESVWWTIISTFRSPV